jgi:hypothetical protein
VLLRSALFIAVLFGAWPGWAELPRWVTSTAADFGLADLQRVRVDPDSLVVLAGVGEETNLALGRKVVDNYGAEVRLTDGGVAAGQSEWVSGTPNVYGRFFTVDLGLDRAIARVRVLAGGSALAQPEYFVRGYRLEAATQRDPDIWRLLAEQTANVKLDVDTRADSTWRVAGEDGRGQPVLGRYVRLTLIRQDRSNWVSVGEIEVFGVGHVETGTAQGEFTGSGPVNVGRVRWEVQVPQQTRVRVEFRGLAEIDGSAGWDEGGADGLFAGPEPVARLQYRAALATDAPFSSPSLRRIEVEYDRTLVAREVRAWVAPDTVRKAALAELTCTAAVEVGAGDYGVDLLRLQGAPMQIDGLRIDGTVLVPREGYHWSTAPEQEATVVELAPRMRMEASGTIELRVRGVFLQDRTPVVLAVGSQEQAARDGYVNWQQARLAEGRTSTVQALGPPPSLIGQVEVAPRPFSPLAGGGLEFRFVVGNLQQEARIALSLFTLDGRRVGRMEQAGRARPYLFIWGGRDQDERIVEPGLYLYEVRVETGDEAARRRGLFAVAY